MMAAVFDNMTGVSIMDLDNEPELAPDTITFEIHVKVYQTEDAENPSKFLMDAGIEQDGDSFTGSSSKHTVVKLSKKKYVVITTNGDVYMCRRYEKRNKFDCSYPFDFASSKKMLVGNLSDLKDLRSNDTWKEIKINVMVEKDDDNTDIYDQLEEQLAIMDNVHSNAVNIDTDDLNYSKKTLDLNLTSELNSSFEENTEMDTFDASSAEDDFNDSQNKVSDISLNVDSICPIRPRFRICKYCSKDFSKTTNFCYVTHLRRHKGIKPFKCVECQEGFHNYESMCRHKNTVHYNVRPFPCNLCNKAFRTNSNLQVHIQRHSEVRKHQCDICGKGFIFAKLLANHKAGAHKEGTQCLCYFCGGTYSDEKSLRTHIKTRHPNGELEQCKRCDQLACQCGNWRHEAHHKRKQKQNFPQDPNLFNCKYCAEIFHSAAERKKHVIAEHQDQKIYTCGDCDRSFFSVNNLQTHVVIHGDKRYQCTVCDKKFTQNSNLKAHMILHSQTRVYTCENCKTNELFPFTGRFVKHVCRYCNIELKIEKNAKVIINALDIRQKEQELLQ